MVLISRRITLSLYVGLEEMGLPKELRRIALGNVRMCVCVCAGIGIGKQKQQWPLDKV